MLRVGAEETSPAAAIVAVRNWFEELKRREK
jgi:hypothetical protein